MKGLLNQEERRRVEALIALQSRLSRLLHTEKEREMIGGEIGRIWRAAEDRTPVSKRVGVVAERAPRLALVAASG